MWNALNQLVEVKEGTTTVAAFEYDGAGRRTEKIAGGLTRVFVYDAEDIIEERISGSTTDTIRYYHGDGIDEPLARKNSSDVVRYYLADHLGSIVQESSAAGAITLEREYDPWGVLSQRASTSGYGFTGREWDAEAGIAFFRARYYSPGLGRFPAEDGLGVLDGVHLSAYVRNRPLSLVDPLGLCSEDPQDSERELLKRILTIKDSDERQRALDDALRSGKFKVSEAGMPSPRRLALKAAEIIAKELKGSVRSEFPAQLLDETLESILKLAKQGDNVARTAKKLLTDKRFRK